MAAYFSTTGNWPGFVPRSAKNSGVGLEVWMNRMPLVVDVEKV